MYVYRNYTMILAFFCSFDAQNKVAAQDWFSCFKITTIGSFFTQNLFAHAENLSEGLILYCLCFDVYFKVLSYYHEF